MRPDLIDVLNAISRTFDAEVAPTVPEGLAKSQSNTISNLLRHATLRAELEGPTLAEDNEDLRAVLDDAAAYARGHADLAELADKLAAPCPTITGPAGYRGLAQVWEEAITLRWRLQHAIEQLQAVRPAHRHEAAYGQLRDAIRGYLDRQLAREGQWITPAFTGPRR